jgi:hypothetical protein
MRALQVLLGPLLPALVVFTTAGTLTPAVAAPMVITISETGGVPISPYLYGINYDWNQVPIAEFSSFATAMAQTAHYTLARYPAGWNAEKYNWGDNTESGKRLPALPGIDPATFLSSVPAASFITPSARAIADPGAIPQVVATSAQLVAKYGNTVAYWEIGNEWWLQSGAKKNPAKLQQNLQNYAALLAAVVPVLKSKNASIKIFATVDWMMPGDVATLRQLTGPAWAQIDGISVHPYCGTADPQRDCSALPEKLAAIRAAAGKQTLYASEWAVAKKLSTDDFGIRNASYTIAALQDLAFSGVGYGAYWPPVKVLPSLAFTSADYRTPFATGLAFGWMSQYYEGTALHTGGPLAAVAARDGATTTVIIPSGNLGSQTVQIALSGTGLSKIVSASVMYSAAPDDEKKASRIAVIVPLPASITTGADGSSFAQFTVDPGTANRGSQFEIVRVTLG